MQAVKCNSFREIGNTGTDLSNILLFLVHINELIRTGVILEIISSRLNLQ